MAEHIFYLLIPRFNMFALSNIMEPVRIANYLSQEDIYKHSFISFDGGEITASNGLSVNCENAPGKLNRTDLVFVLGSWGAEHYINKSVFSWMRLQARNGARFCAVEMGAYLLARAGLLANREATTHWSYLAGFQEQFPEVHVREQLFTTQEPILSCSGATAGIDLMLHLMAQDHGEPLASEVSDQILRHTTRGAKEPQRYSHGRSLDSLPREVQKTIEIMEENMSEPLSVPEISQDIGRSQRQLERQFKKTVGCSIVQFYLLLRLQHARVLLISTDLAVREIATAAGFNSLSHFAYAFKKCFERRPSEYRQAWPEQETAPHWPGTLSRFLESLKVEKKTS